MKKNVFSRTLAVLASTAVLGAASMMSASADNEALVVGSVTGEPGQVVTVPVNVACNDNFESLDIVLSWEDTALTAAKAGVGEVAGVTVASDTGVDDAGKGFCTVVAYGADALADGTIATVNFTIPETAEVGATYDITVSAVNTFAIFEGEDLKKTVPVTNGQIEVVAAPTEPTTEETTEATTEATTTTEAATTAATTTTEAPTTTTAAPTTGAPKTGNAGVAVAVAGLVAAGATAVVLKKRH